MMPQNAPVLAVPEGLVIEDDEWDGMLATAVMDEARAYRYLLTRIWDTSRPPMVWIMLNPSTADALADDATIRRCTGYARRERCGGIAVVNLFALRSTDPRALRDHPNPVGPHNDAFLRHATAGLGPVVVAWGAGGVLGDRAAAVTQGLTAAGVRLHALGVTSTGQPRHPLYLPRNAVLTRYTGTGAAA
ncbi:DUF1643 domain-containing protein [Streptomyces hygroscopicus]|uniref:DUF1643 domain-containing protein n=1 Tax=Streptomyces hygroscopicus TaxID=1912 RepID=UPI0033DBC88C